MTLARKRLVHTQRQTTFEKCGCNILRFLVSGQAIHIRKLRQSVPVSRAFASCMLTPLIYLNSAFSVYYEVCTKSMVASFVTCHGTPAWIYPAVVTDYLHEWSRVIKMWKWVGVCPRFPPPVVLPPPILSLSGVPSWAKLLHFTTVSKRRKHLVNLYLSLFHPATFEIIPSS